MIGRARNIYFPEDREPFKNHMEWYQFALIFVAK